MENWKLILAFFSYTILVFIIQKIIELIRDKNRIRYEIYSKVFAEKRMDKIDRLYSVLYDFECFVKKYLTRNPEINDFDKVINEYHILFDKTRDELEYSHIYLQDDIYKKAYELMLTCDKALMPASKKVNASERMDLFAKSNLPYLPDDIDELNNNIKNSTDELTEIRTKITETRKDLRDLIQKNKIY